MTDQWELLRNCPFESREGRQDPHRLPHPYHIARLAAKALINMTEAITRCAHILDPFDSDISGIDFIKNQRPLARENRDIRQHETRDGVLHLAR